MSEQREELSTADPAGVPEPGWLLRVSQIEASGLDLCPLISATLDVGYSQGGSTILGKAAAKVIGLR